jgi:hypothetical protein
MDATTTRNLNWAVESLLDEYRQLADTDTFDLDAMLAFWSRTYTVNYHDLWNAAVAKNGADL